MPRAATGSEPAAPGDPLARLWRAEAPQVLAALLRRHGDYGDCEDAVQEAAEAAVRQWPRTGTPADPRAWLIRVASRRLIDRVRADTARTRREEQVVDDGARTGEPSGAPGQGAGVATGPDADRLRLLLLLCAHPSLTRSSQVCLCLRAVAGLGVTQIAAGFGVPARTMTQRLTRARSTLRQSGARFELPPPEELPARVNAVLDACYLIFTEGYTATAGAQLQDVQLAGEAIALTEHLHRALPDHDEVSGALALMLLTHARSPARTDAAGDLVPLAEQDRSRWLTGLIDRGRELLERTLPRGHVGRFQLEAAIAAVHADAASYAQTDWLQISVLYDLLGRVAPSPTTTLNRAVAVAMAHDARTGLQMTDPLLDHPEGVEEHRVHAVRAHLLELAGDRAAAAEHYRQAARLTTILPEQRYLLRRLAALSGGD
ncbi:RNA polymerase sigma factor [Ruania zhangjianzhongii]|uniref:RNA polymerase sigma factor n=1 Tax=Ruania zhangjianzhongii TaxID=2603206 RepID=UPI0011CBE812|nr:sigma-70 family RNA polymerase sigma factor [Ruania zhangjianzhongii]